MKTKKWKQISAMALVMMAFFACDEKDSPAPPPEPTAITEFAVEGLAGKTATLSQAGSDKTCTLVFDAEGAAKVEFMDADLPVYTTLKVDETILKIGRKAGEKIVFDYEDGKVVSREVEGYIRINIVEEIARIAEIPELLSGTFIQEADLYFDEVKDWQPIGKEFSSPFTGSYDGQEYKIHNLNIERLEAGKTMTYTGLFGIAKDAIFENIYIESGEILSNRYVGALTGRIQGPAGKIINCHNKASVTAIDNCAGGLVGQLLASSVKNSSNEGKINSKSEVGGIAGIADYARECLIECENRGEVTGTSGTVGGIAGKCSSEILRCKNSGIVTGPSNIGGIAGSLGGGSGTAIATDCVNAGEVRLSRNMAGGIVGSVGSGGIVSECVNDGVVIAVPQAPEAGEDPIIVKDLGGIAGSASESGTIYKSINSEKSTINAGNANRVGGIAGYARKSVIRECVNRKEIVSTGEGVGTSESIGGIVGFTAGEIIFSTNEAPVSGRRMVGGIAGFTEEGYGKIRMCVNNGDVKGALDFTGGITGILWGSVSGSRNNAKVEGEAYTGGLCGAVAGQHCWLLSSCNYGSVKGTDNVGGVVGEMRESALTQASYSVGDVTGGQNVGGVCGKIDTGSMLISSYWAKYVGKGIASGQGMQNEATYFDDGTIAPDGAAVGWPESSVEHWGIGDGSNKNWWKSMGTKGSKAYPVLFWEE